LNGPVLYETGLIEQVINNSSIKSFKQSEHSGLYARPLLKPRYYGHPGLVAVGTENFLLHTGRQHLQELLSESSNEMAN